MTALAWIHARLVLHLAAVYGHDASKVDSRVASWRCSSASPSMHSAGHAAAGVATTAGVRLTKRHLRGEVLVAVKALLRMVGLKFTRTRMIQLVPLVNVPVLAASNGIAAGRLGAKARNYSRTLPAAT